MILIKCQALFFLKIKKDITKFAVSAVMTGALRVKIIENTFHNLKYP